MAAQHLKHAGDGQYEAFGGLDTSLASNICPDLIEIGTGGAGDRSSLVAGFDMLADAAFQLGIQRHVHGRSPPRS
jgi:hypothetical protein